MGIKMRYKSGILTVLFTILIGYWSLALTYVYNPLSINLNPVHPPIYFINPGNPNVYVTLGNAKTSAQIILKKNFALNIYDEDENGYIYVKGPSPNAILSPGQYYEVKWELHIASFKDLNNVGIIVIDVYFRCDIEDYLASIICYGDYVKAALGELVSPDPASINQSTPYFIDPNKKHNFRVRIELLNDGSLLMVKWFVDDIEIHNYMCTVSLEVVVFESYFGWLNQDKPELKFYAYIDNVEVVVSEGVYYVFEDFEDGIDDIFIEEKLGNVGKRIVYYTYPQNSLKIYNELGIYNLSLKVYSIEGIIPQGFNASIWLNSSGKYTQSIKIINGVIIVDQTSKLAIKTGDYVSLSINLTIPYPSTPITWDLTVKIDLRYEVNEVVIVYYPVRIKVTSQ